MELELAIGTVRNDIKSTTLYLNATLMFDISFQEKVKNYFLFSMIFY